MDNIHLKNKNIVIKIIENIIKIDKVDEKKEPISYKIGRFTITYSSPNSESDSDTVVENN